MRAWITRHLAAIAGALISLPGAWQGFKWLLDWGGRIDVFRTWGQAMLDNLPNVHPALNLLLLALGIGLIWWDLKGKPSWRKKTSASVGSAAGTRDAAAVDNTQPEWDKPLEKQFKIHFKNQTVNVDGYEFIDCNFENVTFKYQGIKPFRFHGKNRGTLPKITTDNKVVAMTMQLITAVRGESPAYSIHKTGARSGDAEQQTAPAGDGMIHPPTVTQSPPNLKDALYIGEIRFDFSKLKTDRYGELTIRVFNGTGRIVEFVNISGHISFNAPNNTDPSRKGRLPTPTLRPDTPRTALQLNEWFLILAQQTPAAEADKMLAMLKANVAILFDLSELNIEVHPMDDRKSANRLPIWDGLSYKRDFGFGRIISGKGEVRASVS